MHYRVSVEVKEKDLYFKVNDKLDVADMDQFVKENVESFLETVDEDQYERVFVELDGKKQLLKTDEQ